MDPDHNSRNTIAFVAVALAILIGYQYLVLRPAEARRNAEFRAHAAAMAQNPTAASTAAAAPVVVTRSQALTQSPRTPIDTPALQGSVALRGGRIDDLFLKDYRQTLAKNAPPVELFRPEGTPLAYFADFGWSGAASNLPTPTSVWRQTGGGTLSPDKPITLSYDNGAGLTFTRTIAVDARYVFTVTDTVANASSAPVTLAPYASVQRQGQPLLTRGFVFEGAVGELGGTLHMDAFKDMKSKAAQEAPSIGGWLGLTDKYWLAAIAPASNETVRATYRMTPVAGVDVYEANYVGPTRTVAPGGATHEVRHLFAGAKKVSILQGYEKTLGLQNFTSSVDWGTLWFLTRPIFWILAQFQSLVGNFGVALLLLTVLVKLVTFPLYNQSYGSMARMKKLQPKIEEIKKRYDKDAVKQQQETMALYKAEKVNPLAGCVPALIPIPIFLALIKVLSVSIEMRQAPFFGWIQDLSEPDPSSIWNLFGLLPFHPAALPMIGNFLGGPLHIGAWAILYGVTTWFSQAMNPQAMSDPTQKQIAQFIPLLFTFFMAQVASGLLVYYTWSGFLSAIQQYYIMHRYKTQNPIDDLIARVQGKPLPAA